MNKWITALTLSTMLSAGIAFAQDAKAPAAQPAPPPASAPAATAPAAAPNVESIDILKQNQAERTRDQPGNNAPTWRIVKEGTNNYSSLPGAEMGVLIQPKAQFLGQDRAVTAGEAWRQYRNGPLTSFGGWLLVLAIVVLAVIYFVKGQVKLKEGRTGRLIERFTSLERISHWTVAITFLTLALSGLILLFGKYILMPVFGHTLFSWLAYACKNIHNFVGPLFSLSLIVMFVIYVKDNFPQRGDGKWLARLGGMVGKEHVSAGRFNAGEKLWFWGGVVALGLIVSASGFVLNMLVPGILYTRGTMQIANIIHLIAAVLFVAMSFGHIYLGTIGMEGAYTAMRTGYVDDTWAREHHELWYQQVESGEIPRVRTQERPANVLPARPSKA
ncbi:formate dehydrogenase subunit gamma [Noviherbaspirillum sp. Root189]|uniref:formate dehydrogenase subunit gamma n=1 Tax=Noviherbaspirillum sp. Root189 TaxID=1736487 RepID=UPI00070BD92B|nr:formate dehydrogenase subunit gamma [Noviherbaspirillum sp. Root189]KRB94277.1 formate dehydrogenase [Noviherbaspirillum sp. Root189]